VCQGTNAARRQNPAVPELAWLEIQQEQGNGRMSPGRTTD
jgi:hypothetical protein